MKTSSYVFMTPNSHHILNAHHNKSTIHRNPWNPKLWATLPPPPPRTTACSEKSACSLNSASSSLGAGSAATATLGGEFSSLTLSDDFPADIFQEMDMSSLNGNIGMRMHLSGRVCLSVVSLSRYGIAFVVVDFPFFMFITQSV